MPVFLKRFIFASLAYLTVGAILGFTNAMPSIGYFSRFAHVHFNLLGFMAMMVFGVGYFILPRFNGNELAFPKWVPVHFWIANVGLIGMVVSKALEVAYGGAMYHGLFMSFATLQAVSIFMFVVNIWSTLAKGKLPAVQTASTPTPVNQAAVSTRINLPKAERMQPITVSQHSRVADLIDIHPPIKQLLVSAGLSSLGLPGHIDKVRQMGVTVGMACRNHGLDLGNMIDSITLEMRSAGIPIAQQNVTINAEMLIGDVLKNFPETRAVFQRHFGSGCFDCPGQAFESVSMACQVHGIDERHFVGELTRAVN